MKHILAAVAVVALLASCGSSKSVQPGTTATTPNAVKIQDKSAHDYLRRISDNAVYAKAISASVDVTLQAKEKEINVSGKLQMLRGKVIRITLSPFGLMEVGRLEFTPDYVLIMDRLNKRYVKAAYTDLSFLKNNGVTYYTLESLFWNELFLPGKQRLSDDDLATMDVNMNASPTRPVTVKNGGLTFNWLTDVARVLITRASVSYTQGGRKQGDMTFDYADFVAMGAKRFPSKLTMSLKSATNANDKLQMQLEMSRFSNDTKIEERTTVSDRYTKVTSEELLSKLGNM